MQRSRRMTTVTVVALVMAGLFVYQELSSPVELTHTSEQQHSLTAQLSSESTTANGQNYKIPYAVDVLNTLSVKGRAPKTGYTRTQFGNGWSSIDGCDMRNIILNRDLTNTIISDICKVTRGTLVDPYTGKVVEFTRGENTSDDVQIDHVVALSNAWQTGAQQLDYETRVSFANDALELLAVEGGANQAKGDGDAATWLPSNKSFRCEYVARQIAVKYRYSLWVTLPEKNAMIKVLNTCPNQKLPPRTAPFS
ncbi:HNH endonuclease [Candidatus Saccharibacteria bacterium]|nr:HNH endonuclease [Candidatus Saccharibacteria bacterium]